MTLFKLRAVISTGLCLLSHVLCAANPVNGWYFGLITGGTVPLTMDFKGINALTGTTSTGRLSYNLGAEIGGQIGYRCNQLRFEAEGLYNYNSYGQFQIDSQIFTRRDQLAAGVPVRFIGNEALGAGILNGYYDFNQFSYRTNFVPYLGLGIGYAYVSNQLQLLANDVPFLDAGKSYGSPLGQAIIGAEYFVDNTAAISVDYRFIALSGNPQNIILNSNSNLLINSLNLTLNFSFEPRLSS